MSEEEQVGMHQDAENADGIETEGDAAKAHDAQQLFLLVKVPNLYVQVPLVLVPHHRHPQ